MVHCANRLQSWIAWPEYLSDVLDACEGMRTLLLLCTSQRAASNRCARTAGVDRMAENCAPVAIYKAT